MSSNWNDMYTHLKSEFNDKTPTDGIIIISKNKNAILKIKETITFDLKFDAYKRHFYDSSYNIYKQKLST